MRTERRRLEDRFPDRDGAGERLAALLSSYAAKEGVLVLGLARGGVPVAHRVAQELGAPPDVFVVRKRGVPGREELAMGAIATGGIRIINEAVVSQLSIPEEDIARVAVQEQDALQRREKAYRGDRGAGEVSGKILIVVDDGAATGASMKAAIQALRAQEPARIVAALPVAQRSVLRGMERVADEVVCVQSPDSLDGVSLWYQDFPQVSDEEVREFLQQGEP